MKLINAAMLMKKQFKLLNWTGAMRDAFGQPEQSGVWFVWGASGNGKTTFVLQLTQALIALGDKALYNSLEEGAKASMKKAIANVGMGAGELRKLLVCCQPMQQVEAYLRQPRTPRVVVVDSVQMSGWQWADYIRFKEANAHRLLIIVSQSSGNKPIGKLAERIRFDSDQKIYVEGYRAHSNGRSNPGGVYEVWHEGAAQYWGARQQEGDFKEHLKTNTHHENQTSHHAPAAAQ